MSLVRRGQMIRTLCFNASSRKYTEARISEAKKAALRGSAKAAAIHRNVWQSYKKYRQKSTAIRHLKRAIKTVACKMCFTNITTPYEPQITSSINFFGIRYIAFPLPSMLDALTKLALLHLLLNQGLPPWQTS